MSLKTHLAIIVECIAVMCCLPMILFTLGVKLTGKVMDSSISVARFVKINFIEGIKTSVKMCQLINK